MRGARRVLPLVILLPAMAALAACAPAGATTQGSDISSLWRTFLVAAVLVAVVVVGLIAWSVVRYRRRGDDERPPQFREHVALEVLYTAIPVAVVAGLFAATFATERSIDALSPNPAVTIRVTGFQWQWRFEYEGSDVKVVGAPGAPPQMVIPAGRTVRIVLTSADVVHSFYVPEFLFKRDAIPGRDTEFDIEVPQPGVYRGECAEFCGLDHAFMDFSVRAVPQAEFQAWLTSAGTATATGTAP